MIVVDTCIVTHLYNETELTSIAQEVLEINPHWHLPSTWREEYSNVLAKLFRKSNCKQEDVLRLFQSTCDELKNCEHIVDTIEALHLAIHYQISVYDAHFVVLAEQLDTWLITEDAEVLKKCKNRAVSMQGFIKKSS